MRSAMRQPKGPGSAEPEGACDDLPDKRGHGIKLIADTAGGVTKKAAQPERLLQHLEDEAAPEFHELPLGLVSPIGGSAGISEVLAQGGGAAGRMGTPLGRIPALADSAKPIVDGAGNTVRRYQGVVGAKGLYTEGARLVNEHVEYAPEKVHEEIDSARDTAGDVLGSIRQALK
ncbi:hypothetical protein [Streptomyces sp. NPDC005435]|uniref:hypothetical protein n=1 Tax=Streptomyces sp. NPDC005435 TaxID=3154464 RepID=UPI00345729D3